MLFKPRGEESKEPEASLGVCGNNPRDWRIDELGEEL